MADLTRTVKVLFQGEDDISPTLLSITRGVDKFGEGAAAIGEPFAKITTAVFALDAALLALVAGGLSIATIQFASFEDRMLKVKGVLGATTPEYEALTDVVKDLGLTTRFTAEEAAGGLEFLALAGLSVDESISALPDVLNLAQASAVSLGEAADLVTNVLAGYGKEVSALGEVNDVLTATFTNSNTSLTQLAKAFQSVGPVASALGFSIEETAAVLGVLGNAGFQAEKGGTALRNIMLALVAPAGNMGKLMKELGVDTTELGVDFADSRNALDSLGVSVKDTATGKLLPFTDILDQIKAGLDKIPDSADRTATVVEIFGKRGGPQLQALLLQGSDAVQGLQDKIGSLGGVTQKIADEMESGFGGVLRAIRSALEGVTLEVGEKSAAAVKEGAEGAVAILRAVAAQVDSNTFKPLFDVLEDAGDRLGEILQGMSEDLPGAFKGVDFDELVKSFEDLVKTVGDIFKGLDIDISTPKGLGEAIQSVVNSTESLVKVTDGIVSSFEPIIKAVGGITDALNGLDPEMQKSIGSFIGFASQLTIVAGVLSVGGALLGGLKLLAGALTSGGLLATGLTFIGGLLTGPIGLAALLTAASVAAVNFSVGALGEEFDAPIKKFDEFGHKIIEMVGQLENIPVSTQIDVITLVQSGELERAQSLLTQLTLENFGIEFDIIADTGEIVTLKDGIESIPEDKTVDIGVELNDAEIEEIKKAFGMLEEDKTVEITVGADITPAQDKISWFDEDGKYHEIVIDAETTGLDKAQADIEKIPKEKLVEIQLQGDIDTDIARISSQADIVQAAFEWTARVDIAEAEAAARGVEAAFEAAGETVGSLTDATSDMFSSLLEGFGDLSSLDQEEFTGLIEDQMALQERALEAQIKLNDAQVAYMDAKAAALKSGDSLITIDSTGLEPALELIMFEILEKIQIRASEESSEFLLGI